MLGIGCPDRHALPRITSSKSYQPRCALPSRASGFVLRRIAAASRRDGDFLERPVFGVGWLLSNVRGIRGSRSREISVERCRRDTEMLRDLCYGDVGVSKHRLGGLDIVLRQFRRTASGAAKASGGGETRLGALAD